MDGFLPFPRQGSTEQLREAGAGHRATQQGSQECASAQQLVPGTAPTGSTRLGRPGLWRDECWRPRAPPSACHIQTHEAAKSPCRQGAWASDSAPGAPGAPGSAGGTTCREPWPGRSRAPSASHLGHRCTCFSEDPVVSGLGTERTGKGPLTDLILMQPFPLGPSPEALIEGGTRLPGAEEPRRAGPPLRTPFPHPRGPAHRTSGWMDAGMGVCESFRVIPCAPWLEPLFP